MVVILLGPPGVGKGTQAAILAEDMNWAHVSTGDLLRKARREGTELGSQAQGYMDRGELVPDSLILAMVREHLSGLSDDGVLLDGFPRTEDQAVALDEMLPQIHRKVDAVVLLTAPEDVLIKRISGRRSCGECGKVYNVHYNPPAESDVCDQCGKDLTHRADDQEDTVRRRLEVYRGLTEPLIRYYEESGAPFHRIDANRGVEAIQDDIRSVLQ